MGGSPLFLAQQTSTNPCPVPEPLGYGSDSELDYFRHGGILHYVLRNLLAA